MCCQASNVSQPKWLSVGCKIWTKYTSNRVPLHSGAITMNANHVNYSAKFKISIKILRVQFRLIFELPITEFTLQISHQAHTNTHTAHGHSKIYVYCNFSAILFNELANWHLDIFITEVGIFNTIVMRASLQVSN